MKRREFIISTALAASSSSLPLLSKSAPCPPSEITLGGQKIITTCGVDPKLDWNQRISDPGVVWYHDFDTAAEVNAFRWTGGYKGGNDPLALGNPEAPNVAWVATGGADGGGYMQLTRNTPSMDNCYWWRPFSPLTGASNGRGKDDPGANGLLTPQVFKATDGGNQLLSWATSDKSKPGWYGNSSYNDPTFDGTDFYLQLRVMADPRRTSTGNIQVGKFTAFSTTNNSYTNQELVTYGGYFPKTNGAGAPNYHNIYQGHNYLPLADASTSSNGTAIQLGSEISGVCDPYGSINSGCWSYSGAWDTLLYHVSPGHNGVSDTKLEVWAAHPNQTSYTKIWSVIFPAYFDSSGNTIGGVAKNGWNAMLCWIYHNGATMTPFWQRYDQIIFSKSFIPCPRY